MEELQALSRNGRTHWRIYEDELPGEGRVLSKDGLAVPEEEYWEKYYHDPDFVYEWNDGRLEVIPMSDAKGSRSHRWFRAVLDCYLTTYPVGTAVSLEIGFRMLLPHKTVNRIPDLAVVRDDNPVRMGDDDCTYAGTFDLCVESLSHSSSWEIRRDTVEKRDEYARAGVKEYYIIDARGIETVFYRLDRRGMYVPISLTEDGVVRSAVLPGFRFRVSDLYDRPPLDRLADDEVYHDYVFPSHKEVRRRAEQAELRAEQSELRAEHETGLRMQEAARAEQSELRAEHEAGLRMQEAALREQAEKRFAETARNMLANGLNIALIMKYTGLSADELAALSD